MGITGLLPFVKNSCRPANVKDFSGASVAVDAYSWLHKGAFSCAEKLVKGEKTDGYVYYCIKQLNLLLEAGLKPVMVFDGCNLTSKEGTEKKRRENRDKTRQRGKELLCEGKIKEARECFQRCVDVTPEMAREVIEACRKKCIDCVVAPYEADAQLAYLDKIGMVQLIITEDSDLILFGCNRIFFKMDNCGGGLLYEKENLPKSFGSKASKFSFEKFRYMCILSGCDYLPSLSGIGLAKACKFFTLTNNMDVTTVLPKLPSYLKMPRLTVPNEYIDSFLKANNTFLYQLVFCPEKKALVPLTPYPEDVKAENMEYAGKYLPDDLAYQIAMGNVNVKTLQEFDTFSINNSPVINEDRSIVWGSQGSSSSKSSSKVELSAFKFNTPKRKPLPSQKRQFAEMVTADCSGEAACTDEDLFSMYGSKDVKKLHKDNTSFCEEDPLLPSDEENDICDSPLSKASPSEESASQSSPHPKILNIPFRKIVRSRFFAAETKPTIDLNPSSPASLSEESEKKSETEQELFLSNQNDIKAETISDATVNATNTTDDFNFSLELKVSSPKKADKENIAHRFAKKKKSDVKHSILTSNNCDDSSPASKLKSDSWLNVIDDECCASTSTISSTGKSSKLLDFKPETPNSDSGKSSFRHKNVSKKLITTKLEDFKWKKDFICKQKLNSSLGSDGNSFHESYDESRETEDEATSDKGFMSPYFVPVDSLNQDIESETVVTLSSDSEESSSQNIDVNLHGNSFETDTPSKPKNSLSKFSKSLNTKSNKTGKCRSIGLSKNRKGCDKVPKKETLMNFNFISFEIDESMKF